jgi:hypothetical protein
MGWKIFDEAVEMTERRFRYFPRVFRWRGQRYTVEAVERCWTASRWGWKRRIERHYFLVRCGEGLFELYQDIETSLWHLRRAKLISAPIRSVRDLAPVWR